MSAEVQSEQEAKPRLDARSFSEIASSDDASVGGKAYQLARLAALGFPVPGAIVLRSPPVSESQWKQLLAWWDAMGRMKLAVRSSARAEDSGQASFAGQLTSFVGIDSESGLRSAIQDCFTSIDRAASRAYREHFGQDRSGMNVVVQEMVEPAYSGVFFSRDPRGTSDWLVEAVPGFGESLVSGQKTPMRFSPNASASIPDGMAAWKPESLAIVVDHGRRVREALGFDVDMEWAIDLSGKFWILQARPITTDARAPRRQLERLETELSRLRAHHGNETTWDTQTFAEWTGLPTPLSLDVWKRAFAREGSFLKALRELGYEAGADLGSTSLLDSVFGRACLNLRRLQPEFFGRIPYTTRTEPHPHLEFDWHKIDLATILHAPAAISRMIFVAWKIQSRHQELLGACTHALEAFETREQPGQSDVPLGETVEGFLTHARNFSDEALVWPFILATLTESSLNSLETVLAQDVGEKEASALVRQWMSTDLSTVTAQMDREYRDACQDPQLREAFLKSYGHRASGELELARPRWRELGDRAFAAPSIEWSASAAPRSHFAMDVEQKVHWVRRTHVTREWAYLKALLELRERWKMAILRPYSDLRRNALAIGNQRGLGEDIFWLTLDELSSDEEPSVVRQRILERKADAEAFRTLPLPRVFSLKELDEWVHPQRDVEMETSWQGEPLSPGVVSGTVRIVREPNQVDLGSWPRATILVAESTDPGWTPLFQKASGIVVERGGVLSHCAIVAREMGLPAVSQIMGCTQNLKDGDHVWVDGNLGRVELARGH